MSTLSGKVKVPNMSEWQFSFWIDILKLKPLPVEMLSLRQSALNWKYLIKVYIFLKQIFGSAWSMFSEGTCFFSENFN